jgi:hypothetical protein
MDFGGNLQQMLGVPKGRCGERMVNRQRGMKGMAWSSSPYFFPQIWCIRRYLQPCTMYIWGFCENEVTMKMVISCRPILYVSDVSFYASVLYIGLVSNDEKPQRTCTRDLQSLDYLVSISTWKQLRNPHRNTGGFPTRSNQVKFPNSFSTQWLSDVVEPLKNVIVTGDQSILISVVEKCWSYNHQQELIKTVPNRWWFNMSWFPMIPHHLLVNKPTYILSH